ncbi:unnamed protein product [Rhizophagus irregularis]|nr:unnamed protein product [Rhizophagus irregularis]
MAIAETFNNFRKNSGNNEPVDIIIIFDDKNDKANEATDDKATDDETIDYRISFNFDKLEKQLEIKFDNINVMEKFRQYQQDLLHDVKYGTKVFVELWDQS